MDSVLVLSRQWLHTSMQMPRFSTYWIVRSGTDLIATKLSLSLSLTHLVKLFLLLLFFFLFLLGAWGDLFKGSVLSNRTGMGEIWQKWSLRKYSSIDGVGFRFDVIISRRQPIHDTISGKTVLHPRECTRSVHDMPCAVHAAASRYSSWLVVHS